MYQDGSLSDGVLHLVLFDEVLLVEGLDCVHFVVILLLAQNDLAVRASSNNLDQLKVVNGNIAVLELYINH